MFNLSKTEVLGFTLILLLAIVSLLAPLIVSVIPHDVSRLPYAPPSHKNLLGTNDIGEDVLVELIYGARVSLTIGVVAALISTVIGLMVGVTSGFYGGLTDEILSFFTDVVLVLPALPLIIVVAAYLKPSIWNVVLVISLLWWPGTARLVRARTMQLSEGGFVEGLRCIGASRPYIILKHIVPNVTEIVFAKFVTSVAQAILIEAGLSFIGLGDPEHKSWGLMLHYAIRRGGLLRGAWWAFIPPGLCITLTALAFILIGMGFEERSRIKTKEI